MNFLVEKNEEGKLTGRLVNMCETIRTASGGLIIALPEEPELIPRMPEVLEEVCGIDDPENAIQLDYPLGFSEKAWAGIKELEGAEACYYYNGEFYVTDEGCDLSAPRWKGITLEEMEAWWEQVAQEHAKSA